MNPNLYFARKKELRFCDDQLHSTKIESTLYHKNIDAAAKLQLDWTNRLSDSSPKP